ncbi:9413_t:CDS:2, partial [Gigaspora rosea]
RLTNSCHVGWYNEEERLNAYRARHGIAQVEKIFLEKSNFSNFELRNISVYLKIATYYNKQKDHTINIPVKQENQVIIPLQSPLTIRAYIIKIYDIDLAKKTSVNITNLLVDYNLQNIQFKKNATVHLQNEIIIDFCVLSEEEDQARIFDKGTLGVNFNVVKGDSGILLFLSGGYLEAAYMPNMKHGPTFNTDYGATVDTEFDFRPQIENIEEENDAKERTHLYDIAIQLKFTSVHNEDIQKRTQIPVHAIAIEAEPLIGNIILNSDIQNIQFREYIESHLETEYIIKCDSCEFQNHEVNLCLDLKKLKVYAFENDEKKKTKFIEFGENFSSTEGNSEILMFFHSEFVETAWKPDFSKLTAFENIFNAIEKY